jgi:hypothetical protein
MIDIDYSNGKIKINTGDLTGLFTNLPLKFKIKKVISKEIVWETSLYSFMWAEFGTNEINDVVVEDSLGNFVYQYHWDVIQHGSIFYKSLWLYCKSLITLPGTTYSNGNIGGLNVVFSSLSLLVVQ